MTPLAAAGFHVVAPDLRGYGRTTGWSANYDDASISGEVNLAVNTEAGKGNLTGKLMAQSQGKSKI